MLLLAALVLWGSGAALAQARPPGYLAAPLAASDLPVPPAKGSAAQRADLLAIMRLQRARTPERIAQAQADQSLDVFALYRPILGPDFTAANRPRLAALFQRVSSDTRAAVMAPKTAHKRPRPPLVSPRVRPCVDLPEEGLNSYPSGHAMWGRLTSVLLARLHPDKAAALTARGLDFGHSRAVCAVHFPTDVAAGQQLADALARALSADAGFRADFAAAQAEAAGTR